MKKKPDIIFIHTDQWNAEAFSACGETEVSTPFSDRIFEEGMRFDRAVATAPICVPNRTCWYTGLMPCEHGNLSNGWRIVDEVPDLGQWLSARGYNCQYGGKWHVTGRGTNDGFGVYCGSHALGEVYDDALAQSAEAVLAGRQDDRPLFLNVGIMNPHDCCYLNRSGTNFAIKLGLQPAIEEALPGVPPDYDPGQTFPSNSQVVHWGPEELKLYRYYYYRMCEMADQAIGRIHAAVRKYCDPDNTILIFTADHGEFMGHRNRFSKGLLYDPSQRVPLSISGPGIQSGAINSTQIPGAVDITATILDYAGADPMPGMQFAASLRPVLEGRSDAPLHPYTPGETLQGGLTHSFRSGEYKSIFHARRKSEELYHLPSDPWEQNNLAADPGHAGTMEEHRGFYQDFRNRVQLAPLAAEEWAAAGLI